MSFFLSAWSVPAPNSHGITGTNWTAYPGKPYIVSAGQSNVVNGFSEQQFSVHNNNNDDDEH